MLIHIVCWKYRDTTDAATRERHIEMLRTLADKIDVIRELHVGADILHLDRSYDTGLVAKFDDRDALDIYTDHPEHQQVATFGREIAERAVSVDYTV